MGKNKKLIIKLAITVLTVAVSLGIIAIFNKDTSSIYEYNGKTVDADQYYKDMYEQYGVGFVFQFMEKEYFSTKTIDAEKQKDLDEQVKQLLEEAEAEEDRKAIDLTLRSFAYLGIDELPLYLKNTYLKNTLVLDNMYDKFTEFDAFSKEYKPRTVTHVLVLAEREDKEHESASAPTAKEKEYMNKIDAALKDGSDVKVEMIKQTLDEAVVGEQLGYVDKDTKMVKPFLDAALAMNGGEVSTWVKSEFGYHRIFIESTDLEVLKTQDAFKEKILNLYPSITVEIVLEDMKKNNVVIDAEFEKELLELVGA